MGQLNTKDYLDKIKTHFKKRCLNYNPSFDAFDGIKYDFCFGLRIFVPETESKKRYRLEVADFTKDIKLFDLVLSSGEYFISLVRYYLPYSFRITNLDTGETFKHSYNAENKKVFIDLPFDAIGDAIAWFTAAERFQQKHKCELYIRLPKSVKGLFEPVYPHIHFVDRKEKSKIADLYANYQMCIYTEGESECIDYPVDYRQTALHHYGAFLLGLTPEDVQEPPKIHIEEDVLPVTENYVCIGTHASALCKEWLNPSGWDEVVSFLNSSHYYVCAIDRNRKEKRGFVTTDIPRHAEDCTGNFSLSQRAAQIMKSDFFIGVGSGLSWIAWCCHKPIVLISGFSDPINEFYTPYRVQNRDVCHGCYADTRIKKQNGDLYWCPRHKDKQNQFICSIGITPKMVIDTIKTIPEYMEHIHKIKTEQQKEIEDGIF